MLAETDLSRLSRALPFWVSLTLIPLLVAGALTGGWLLVIVPVLTWYCTGLSDVITGVQTENADPATPDEALFWFRLVTLIWAPLQFVTLFGLLFYATRAPHLSGMEQVVLFVGVGVMTGTIGINYSHELMHQKSRLERGLADWLLAMVLYSHFRSEHLLVHHRYVGTPRDPVTASYNEGFHRFFFRVLPQCLASALRAEAARQTRAGRSPAHRSNPFWRYAAYQGAMLGLAAALGGWTGVGLFALQALVAVWQLELVNYVEHYGLTRKHLGEGRYEHVRPHHSWNASYRASNWLLINLQRHSDHHYKPDRRFPLLQHHDAQSAPQLPFSYPVMTVLAMIPPIWRRMMNPRVRAWRRMHYPEISDWSAYKTRSLPLPR